ncbi:hypothetical protein CYY_001896 [Polysphondylium violaceum]|uniref:Complex 1 LYR protein domain-containing protein n=1 Tax=Polysphondylium violaceum TaxID=133409 RepID=A0A8J4Q111_9MYCE|nr:hypothetical protein CYY_001896 [Polysphondylium violaceum]
MVNTTLHLYRNLIRASNLFLVSHARKDRCLSTFIKDQTQKSFRENKDVNDSTKIKQLLAKANRDYLNFKDLVENKNLSLYPCSIKVRPDYVQKSNVLLSSANQDRIKNKKWGFVDRLKVIFTREE